MNRKKLVFDVLLHKDTPRVPWLPFVGVHAGHLVGYNATEMLTDEDKIIEGMDESIKLFSPDGFPVFFDLQIEAEILGCELVWADQGPPSVKTHPLANVDEVPCKCLVPSEKDGRLPIILSVMDKMVKKYGEEIALYATLCGPFTLASHLRGNDIFMDMFDDEDYVKELMDYCVAVSKALIDMYEKVGMHVIAMVDPLISQISADHFEEFCSDAYTEIFKYIKEKGLYSSFFVCGNATRNIEVMCKTNPDSIAVDENVKMSEAKEITDEYNVVLCGNIPLTTTMLHGTQQDNMKYVIGLLDTLTHKNLIISPGCDMPFTVPAENTIGAGQAVIETEKCREMIKNYEGGTFENIEVIIPDYASLAKPLVEVFTLDSETCAACTYMMGAANVAKETYGDKIDVIEYKFTEKENIARCMKMGVGNLPAMYINGKLAYSSIIPSKTELEESINEVM